MKQDSLAELHLEANRTVYRPRHNADMFLEKVFMLVQKMFDHHERREAFHALVLCKSLYHNGSRRVVGGDFADGSKRLDTAIRDLMDESLVPAVSGAFCTFKFDLYERNLHKVEGRSCALRWSSSSQTSGMPFMDAARAARLLRTAYMSITCNERLERPSACFHTSNVKLLDWLQKKAWSEIRTNIFQSIRIRLPAELTEIVFEFALAAEELPCNPALWDACRCGNMQEGALERYLRMKPEYAHNVRRFVADF